MLRTVEMQCSVWLRIIGRIVIRDNCFSWSQFQRRIRPSHKLRCMPLSLWNRDPLVRLLRHCESQYELLPLGCFWLPLNISFEATWWRWKTSSTSSRWKPKQGDASRVCPLRGLSKCKSLSERSRVEFEVYSARTKGQRDKADLILPIRPK